MGSSPATTLSLITYYLLISFSGSSSLTTHRSSDTDKVSVALYYESLCPFSANFIVNYLDKLYQDDELLSIVDLHLSPWGNAKIKENHTFTCQHGPYECLLNTVEACAIHAWPQLDEHFPFVYCVERLVYERKYTEWESCFEELNLDSKPVSDCVTSGYGDRTPHIDYICKTPLLRSLNEKILTLTMKDYADLVSEESFYSSKDGNNLPRLDCKEKINWTPKECKLPGALAVQLVKLLELKYAAETNALQPPHRYVPWVVVDGQPLYEDYENFVSYICKAYKGTAVPKACSKLSHYSIQRPKAKSILQVCYRETITSTILERTRSVISSWMQ